MTDQEVLSYVKAASVALGLTLDEAQQQRVAVHLARTAGMAGQLTAFGLTVADEPAEIYSPLPFQASYNLREQL
ncbi:MAG: DUF4089 domain-containing protein [Polaromonas sp.]|uniref:DUF4089 domain-containing protein n=1 Tax=Polaromonas sp. TaxID=1869339 RepID=UPI00272F31F3|nr:DUF4089 domain-containing protein [Polaromonas sp.]MDP1741076.1 DUF4089 domain-containing protein [Polaromonas sp.]MDP1953867.1 DUF4089 domain-containing protein [Polaromonas sp.]MDP3356048.1 DUF4089 domain-containing protein [Polaromonas sp.]MDP3752730.1 DUF4089 domain-containing protein [Polaromonas sp.]